MPAEVDPLLEAVCRALDATGTPYALIGAGALLAHGHARLSDDLDLLVLDPSVLDPRRWTPLAAQGVNVEIRRGDMADPLIGVVRFVAAGDVDVDAVDAHGEPRLTSLETVDLVLIRGAWARDVLARAVAGHDGLHIGGRRVPAVSAADLVLLKLYAGGPLDLRDIELLLLGADRLAIVSAVDAAIDALPMTARRAWQRLRQEPSRG